MTVTWNLSKLFVSKTEKNWRPNGIRWKDANIQCKWYAPALDSVDSDFTHERRWTNL